MIRFKVMVTRYKKLYLAAMLLGVPPEGMPLLVVLKGLGLHYIGVFRQLLLFHMYMVIHVLATKPHPLRYRPIITLPTEHSTKLNVD